MLNNNIYINLRTQSQRLFKHNRQGSIKTRYRYKAAFERFLRFLAEFFRLEKIANIALKHIRAYVDYLIEHECTIAYIKTELAAIRFWHDKIPEPRHSELPTNKMLHLGNRQYGGINRTWSLLELARMIDKAVSLGHDIYVDVLHIARYMALRIEECFKIDTAAARKALETGVLTIKGKGGLIREIPLHEAVEIILRNRLKVTSAGHKLFVMPDEKTHEAMKHLQDFIDYHRKDVQEEDSDRPMTFHGLRHLRAAEWYTEFVAQGMTEKQARLAVAKLLGHGRDSVTKFYLVSLKNRGDANET